MNEFDKDLSFLLTRLAWPSGMVRERACVSIADLLLDPGHAKITEISLINWIKEQSLESTVSMGLLVLLYAKTTNPEFALPPRGVITAAIAKSSLLSHIMLKELFPGETISSDINAMNSGQVPDEFDIDPFFIKYSRNFLPPMYMDMMEHIESARTGPLIKQWAFEWSRILESAGKKPSSQSLNFLYENEYSDYAVVRDVYLSEVYRSAYLRTISWAIISGTISENEGYPLAIQTCPIDLGLWLLKPNLRPEWWPMHKAPLESEAVHKDIWNLIDIFCTKQLSIKDDWIIAEASGYVHRENSLYDLEINGFFQKQPNEIYNLESICNKYRLPINEIHYDPFDNGLIFQGILEPRSIDSFSTQFDHMIPASCFIWPLVAPRWQFWRMHRGLWLPNPCISPYVLAFKCSKNAIIVSDGEEIIGKWIDWRDILKEKASANLPPLTGQYLQIKRDKINEFMQRKDLTFSWICRLTKYERDHNYKKYSYSMEYRIYK